MLVKKRLSDAISFVITFLTILCNVPTLLIFYFLNFNLCLTVKYILKFHVNHILNFNIYFIMHYLNSNFESSNIIQKHCLKLIKFV